MPVPSDEEHEGGIQGALGTIRVHDEGPRRSWRGRVLTLLAIIGPGLIVMVGDNDAGGVSTYAQAGQNFGLSLLWTLPLLIPVLIVNQEMVVRLGAVCGVGHARLINERFGKFWGAFSVGDLFVLNFLTIVTEFIGVSLALGYFGVSAYVSVPLAALGLVAMTATRQLPALGAVHARVHRGELPRHPAGHLRPSPRRAGAEALRDARGRGRVQLHLHPAHHRRGRHHGGSVAVVLPAVQHRGQAHHAPLDQLRAGRHRAGVVHHRSGRQPDHHHRRLRLRPHPCAREGSPTPAVSPTALDRYLGNATGTLFAIILLNASIIGAAAVTLSTSYAFGDIFGTRHSLNRRVRDAKFFYATFTGIVAAAATIVLIPGAPLGVITTAVQALAGILLPSATVFLLLLCNDKAVLGPWVNRPWLNIVSTFIVSVLFVLSLILMTTTVFPHIDVPALLAGLSGALGAGPGRGGGAVRTGPAPPRRPRPRRARAAR